MCYSLIHCALDDDAIKVYYCCYHYYHYIIKICDIGGIYHVHLEMGLDKEIR